MSHDTRHVRRLTLTSPREHVRRVAFLVEDGLRTASLPGATSRLILIRSFALGQIDPRENATGLSQRIERAWRTVARAAVSAEDRFAPQADAVFFSSLERALAIYLAGRIHKVALAEWFWDKVPCVPRNALSVSAAFSQIVSQLLCSKENGALRVLELLDQIRTLDALPALARRVETSDLVPILIALTGIANAPPLLVDNTPSREAAAPHLPAVFREIVRQSAPAADPQAATAAFFWAVAGAIAQRPWLASSKQELVRHATALLSEALSLRPRTVSHSYESDPQAISSAVKSKADPSITFPQAPPSSTDISLMERAGARKEESTKSEMLRGRAATDGESRSLETLDADLTSVGGLFFALPFLSRLGFDAYLDERPDLFDLGLLPALLGSVARSAGARVDDPIWVALGEAGMDPAPELHSSMHHWHTNLRRTVRREARMLLNWIVRRSGRVSVTRSHIELFFEVEQADIRVRRMALDVNPGWIRALGKVVAYHYGPYGV